MKNTVERLHEKRQIELAKSILENAGYTVLKEEEEDPIKLLQKKKEELRDKYIKYRDGGNLKGSRKIKFLVSILKDIFSKYEGEFQFYNRGIGAMRDIGLIAGREYIEEHGKENTINALYSEIDDLFTSEGWRKEAKGTYIKDGVAKIVLRDNIIWGQVSANIYSCTALDEEIMKDTPEDIEFRKIEQEIKDIEKEIEDEKKKRAKKKSRRAGGLSSKISNAGEDYITIGDLLKAIESGDVDDEDGTEIDIINTVASMLKSSPDDIFIVTENRFSEESSEAFNYLHNLADNNKSKSHKVIGTSEGKGDYRTHLYLYNTPEGKFVYSSTYGYEEFYYL